MDNSRKALTRRDAVKNIVVLPALLGALAAGATATARADSRTDLKYQDKPKNDQKCSDCVLFTPGKTPTANGTCKVISGDISPNGWCTAFAKKSS